MNVFSVPVLQMAHQAPNVTLCFDNCGWRRLAGHVLVLDHRTPAQSLTAVKRAKSEKWETGKPEPRRL